MKKIIKNNLFFVFGFVFIFFFFNKVFIGGLLPIPTDNIVGVYHPYKDYYADQYPRGIPFSNIQVSDPVRQQYLWRELAVSIFKKGELPLWNPYNFSGYPLLANFQSAVFYPLNLMMFILPFEYGWTALIISQPLLAFLFMYMFIVNLGRTRAAAFISGIALAFSGFFVSWLEWGNIASTGLWLPLILLLVDKITSRSKLKRNSIFNIWILILLLSLVSSFFAGHLQTFIYLSVVSFGYAIFRWLEAGRSLRVIFQLSLVFVSFLAFTAIQWIPTLQLISLSARDIDQVSSNIEGWFVPWQNLVQFVVPDFFGNPATLNYWGVWNYGEFIGYVGILPLILFITAVIFVRNKTVFFFLSVLVASLVFSLPSFISNIPYFLDIPFLSSTQPTRLMYLVGTSMVILAAFGFDYIMENRRKVVLPVSIVALLIISLWVFIYSNNFLPNIFQIKIEDLSVARNNLIFPSLVIGLTSVVFFAYAFVPKRFYEKKGKYLIMLLILIFLFDIFRFADKYTVFSEKEYLYPTTKAIEYLQKQEVPFRLMEADSRVLPPNFTISHRMQSVDGYDPLYLLRYGELVAAISRNNPNIDPPFGFNRIITPQNFSNRVANILGARYVLSLSDIEDDKYVKVFEENETKVYKNEDSIDRVFFVNRTIGAEDKNDSIKKLFEQKDYLGSVAIVEGDSYLDYDRTWSPGTARINLYDANRIIVDVENEKEGFLVLTDSFYPTWSVSIDGVDSEILRTNYNFRGVVVPGGSSQVVLVNNLF